MGENARYKGEIIKIGTCEQMYYLRADQAHLVTPVPNSCDPVGQAQHLRFRFPFPDEDGIEPGCFEPFDRSVDVDAPASPIEECHERVTFESRGGYSISLPCPESPAAKASPVQIKRHTTARGLVGIHSQRCLDGLRMLVCRCNACGGLYRVGTLEDARPIIKACEDKAADLLRNSGLVGYRQDVRDEWKREAAWWTEIAARIAAGYVPGAGDLGPPQEREKREEPAIEPVAMGSPLLCQNTNAAAPHLNVSEACAVLRAALKAATGRAWSVSHGRGTAYGWITVHAMPRNRVGEWGYLSPGDAAELARVFGEDRPVHQQGLSISPDERGHYVARIQVAAAAPGQAAAVQS